MSISFLPSFNIWNKTVLDDYDFEETLPLYKKNKNDNDNQYKEPYKYDAITYIYKEYNDIIEQANNLNSKKSTNKDITDLAERCSKLQYYIKENNIIIMPSKSSINFHEIWSKIDSILDSSYSCLKRIFPSYIKYKDEWNEIEKEHIQYRIVDNSYNDINNNYNDDDDISVNSNYDIEKYAGLSDYNTDTEENDYNIV